MTLESRNLTIGYSEQNSLKVQNLNLPRYQVISLQGKNGSGKSTFLKTITGFIPPLSGALLWNHQPFKHQEKKRILLPQQPTLLNTLTVEEHIRLITLYHGASSLHKEIIELCQLSPIRQTLCQRLSGGQQRALALACAALCHPLLLALDEPTHELDSQLQASVHQLMRLLSSQGTLIIFSTHQAEEAHLYNKQLFIQDHTLYMQDLSNERGNSEPTVQSSAV